MNRATVDCSDPPWSELVRAQLEAGGEADLINFYYDAHGAQCELLARELRVEFSLARDPHAQLAQFRHRPGA